MDSSNLDNLLPFIFSIFNIQISSSINIMGILGDVHIYTHVCIVILLINSNYRFGRGTQEDSHEVLRCLLSGLREEEINVSHYNTSFLKFIFSVKVDKSVV